MIKTNKNTYLITPSLLNAWIYAIDSDYGTVEDFLNTLNRVPTPTNENIRKGFIFEQWCEDNYDDVQGGVFQCVAKKQVGDFLLYGRADCVKAGIIYDFKYTGSYEVGKYLNNAQTSMYLEMIPEAKEIKYIVTNQIVTIQPQPAPPISSLGMLDYIDLSDFLDLSDSHEPHYEAGNIFVETYRRDETTSIMPTIYEFMNWLEIHGYMDLYKQIWLANGNR